MRTLIFDSTLTGHHLEYLHHYYRGILTRKNEDFVICVPEDDFNKQKDNYVWRDSNNVIFEFLSSEDLHHVSCKSGMNRYFAEAQLIACKAKELNVNRVILTNFIHTIPFLLWLMPKKVKVRGIIYRIYLYGKKNLRYRIENFCYWLMAKSKIMDRIFILNDQNSADRLNNIHKTDKFTFLPDPVPEVDKSILENIRDIYGIPIENKVFLHFGGLTKRKGTLEILKAIDLCDGEILKNKTFIFAGRIYDDMSEEFYKLENAVKQKTQIIVFDEFCSYIFLYKLCYSSDVILIPYQQTNLSSGVLGYAAVFEKPVIGPIGGLIGNLIRKYQMGYVLPEITDRALSESFSKNIKFQPSEYVKQNQLEEFINCIFE